MSLISALILIATIALMFGGSYAILIYHRPFPHGWTWLSVMIGDGATDLFLGLALLAIFISSGWGQYWYIVFLPIAAHILTGGPMIVGQVIKWWNEQKQVNDRKKKFE